MLPIPGKGHTEPAKLRIAREIELRVDQLWKETYNVLGNDGGVAPALDAAWGAIGKLVKDYEARLRGVHHD